MSFWMLRELMSDHNCPSCGEIRCVCINKTNYFGGGPQMSKKQYDEQSEMVCKDCNKWPCLCSLSVKDTNPKDAVGIKKAPISTVSGGVMAELGLAMMEGALKYGRHNYRVAGVRASVYRDSIWRHLLAWWDFSQDVDPDSGLNHITKAIAGLMVLRDSMLLNNWVDDRPPPLPIELLEEYNKIAKALIEKYPNPKRAFTKDDINGIENEKVS